MNAKRIYIAINEGINKALMNFDTGQEFKKTNPVYRDIKEFHFGDYVYKDSKLGYNNYIGEKVAVCAAEDDGVNLYAVLSSDLIDDTYPWATYGSPLNCDILYNGNSGLENTQNVLDNYGDCIAGTIWELLKPDEYIPSSKELEKVFINMVTDDELYKKLNYHLHCYWGSDQCPYDNYYDSAYYFDFDSGRPYYMNKTVSTMNYAIPFLNVK